MRTVRPCLLAALLVATFAPTLSDARNKLPASPVAADRSTEPVILKGRDLGAWSAPANQTVRLPFMDLAGSDACSSKVDPSKVDPSKVDPGSFDPTSGGIGVPDPSGPTGGAVTYDPNACPPQDYAQPQVDTAAAQNGVVSGTPTDEILGYRYDRQAGEFRQIPLQVDEVFTRYLSNSRSGFALYSGEDQHTTYAYDREGFRYTDNDPQNPCRAIPREVTQPDGSKVRLKALPDPVPGLDNNDEVAFMYGDAGPRAPQSAALPDGIAEAKVIALADPFGTSKPRYVYVMKAKADGPNPAFTAANGYVDYKRDANADTFAYSQSSYGDYGNAPKGPYCTPDGKPDTSHGATAQRRPLDTATISTARYRFRYDGRWLMTGIQIKQDRDKAYGPDLVDRWKARAFAQDPSSKTPCCGYEEEDSNWGGSGITLGERVGPVRAIRETWGADSGTNVIRRETFYKSEMRQKTWLRVHVIPPVDGIYSQWDFNAGAVKTFYNPRSATVQPNGWPIDGKNDEVFGNLDDPCNDNYDGSDTGAFTQGYRQGVQTLKFGNYSWCGQFPYHQSMDLPDPSVSDANAALSWSEVTGPNGTIVDRTSASIEDLTPGGAAQSVLAVPYYRDDACFDDGTGSDPGRELYPRESGKERASGANGARTCWRGTPSVPGGDPKFWQGSIATHGLHILFLADSDNARQTIPTDEIVAETRMVMAPGEHSGAYGEQVGRGFEKQLAVAVAPFVPVARPGTPPVTVPDAPSVGVPSAPSAPSAPSVGVPSTPGALSVNVPSAPSTPSAGVGVPGSSSSSGSGSKDSGSGDSAKPGQTPAPSDDSSKPGSTTGNADSKPTPSGSSHGGSGQSPTPSSAPGKRKPKHKAKPKHHKAKPKHHKAKPKRQKAKKHKRTPRLAAFPG